MTQANKHYSIMIVEDDKRLTTPLTAKLEELGHAVQLYATHNAAVNALKSGGAAADVILLDDFSGKQQLKGIDFLKGKCQGEIPVVSIASKQSTRKEMCNNGARSGIDKNHLFAAAKGHPKALNLLYEKIEDAQKATKRSR